MNDALLLIYADAVDDFERVRLATESRVRSLIDIKKLPDSPEVSRMEALVGSVRGLELQAIRDLERAMRDHLFGAWVERNKGVGLKGIGRLLAAIGDPATRENPAKLFQYCGHGDPERSRRRAGTNDLGFSPKAKTRLWVVSESAYRQGVYRDVYLEARKAAAGKVHTKQCQNTIPPVAGKPNGSNGCGTQAHPELGAPGSPWRDGHQHAHAIRVVGKAILLDLWLYARELNEGDEGLSVAA